MTKDKNVELKTENWNGNNIRFICKKDEWFAVLKDACKALDLQTKEVSRQLKELYEENESQSKKDKVGTTHLIQNNDLEVLVETSESEPILAKIPFTDTLGRIRPTLIVSELGLYDIISQSRKKEAREFRQWVYKILRTIRQQSGLEGFQVFRMLDKEHQKQAMANLQQGMNSKDRPNFCKANTIADKAVSTMFGFPKMLKKGQMNPEMLVARQPILDEVIELMTIQHKYNLDFSVSKKIYEKWT